MIFKDSTILVDSKDYSNIATEERDSGQEYVALRTITPLLAKDKMHEILKEFQIYNWSRRTKFCGVCGANNKSAEDELCKVCPECGERNYPYLFPAVIVAITSGEKLLMAHNVNFPGNMHSVVAGFVDIGESLEETVIREVKEEVGIEIKNIKYFGSQNWGYSSSLMIGFKAEFSSGDIVTDDKEIDSAGWFSIETMPDQIPPLGSIGRALIDDFIDTHKNK